MAVTPGCVTRPVDGNQLAAAPTPVPPKNSQKLPKTPSTTKAGDGGQVDV